MGSICACTRISRGLRRRRLALLSCPSIPSLIWDLVTHSPVTLSAPPSLAHVFIFVATDDTLYILNHDNHLISLSLSTAPKTMHLTSGRGRRSANVDNHVCIHPPSFLLISFRLSSHSCMLLPFVRISPRPCCLFDFPALHLCCTLICCTPSYCARGDIYIIPPYFGCFSCRCHIFIRPHSLPFVHALLSHHPTLCLPTHIHITIRITSKHPGRYSYIYILSIVTFIPHRRSWLFTFILLYLWINMTCLARNKSFFCAVQNLQVPVASDLAKAGAQILE